MEEEKYKELLNILSNVNENTLEEYDQIKLLFKRFIFLGNKTQQFRQVGNAVPPIMAKEIAIKIIETLEKNNDCL